MFNFFGRKSAPPEVRPFVPGWIGGSEAGFARGYEAQFEQIFRRNPVGQRAVRLLSSMVAGLPIHDERGTTRAAALVKTPGLLEAATAGLLLDGNAYVKLLSGADDEPAELYAMRPERVRVACDARGVPSAYLLRGGGGAVQRHARLDGRGRVQVAHLKALNPADDLYGAGCMDAAIAAASIHNQAAQWNKALLDNAARPSGALTYAPADGSVLSSEQFERLKGELSEQFGGAGNAGRPLLLDGGLKWQALSLSPADMDFIALKDGAARDIALAFGVPPVLVGLPGDATYANAREAGRALYRQTVLPMARRMLGGLSEMLSDWLGPVQLSIDEDLISELAEDRARLWDVVGAAEFLTREEKREQLGFAREEKA